MTHARPGLEDVLELDRICLREANGEPLETMAHRRKLKRSIPRSEWARFTEMVNLSRMLTCGLWRTTIGLLADSSFILGTGPLPLSPLSAEPSPIF